MFPRVMLQRPFAHQPGAKAQRNIAVAARLS